MADSLMSPRFAELERRVALLEQQLAAKLVKEGVDKDDVATSTAGTAGAGFKRTCLRCPSVFDCSAAPWERRAQKPSALVATGHRSDALTLNVGGRVFRTTCSTLRLAEQGSFLHSLALSAEAAAGLHNADAAADANEGAGAATRVPAQRCPKGHVFIDRSPKQFAKILDFLRSGPDGVALPKQQEDRDELASEASFYGLLGLARRAGRLRLVGVLSEDIGCRVGETERVVAFKPGNLAVVLSVPNPRHFYVTARLEGEEREDATDARAGRHLISIEPWDCGWGISFCGPTEEKEGPAAVKEVWAQWPERQHYLSHSAFVVSFTCLRDRNKSWELEGARLLRNSAPLSPQAYQNLFTSREAAAREPHWKLTTLSSKPPGLEEPPPLSSEEDVVRLQDLPAYCAAVAQAEDQIFLWPSSPWYSTRVPETGAIDLGLFACNTCRESLATFCLASPDGRPRPGSQRWLDWDVKKFPPTEEDRSELALLLCSAEGFRLVAGLSVPDARCIGIRKCARGVQVMANGREIYAHSLTEEQNISLGHALRFDVSVSNENVGNSIVFEMHSGS